MKKEDVKVGMRVKVDNMSTEHGVYEFDNRVTETMLQFIGQEFTVERVDERGGVYFSDSFFAEGFGFPWECLTPAEQPFSIANTKINVQKYAEENGLTFEAACSEVYEWAVPQGYNWRNVSPVCTFSFLFTDTFVDKGLTYSESRRYFDDHPNKEITLSRKVTVELTPSFVEPEKPAVEYVELGGKRYVKSELEEALSKIKAVEE